MEHAFGGAWRVVRIAVAASLALGLGAPVTNGARAAEPEKLTIMVGGMTKLIYLPVRLTEQLGYFKAEGLNVELLSQPAGVDAENELLAGEPAAAVEVLLKSDSALADRGERGLRSTVQAHLAQAHEQLGNSDAAYEAIALAETLGGPDDIVNYVITHGVRARLALREGHGEDAERWARSSVKHAYMTDSIDGQGHARLQLAHVLVSLGRNQEATQEARAASDLFAAKGDEFGRDQAHALLDQLASMSSPAN